MHFERSLMCKTWILQDEYLNLQLLPILWLISAYLHWVQINLHLNSNNFLLINITHPVNKCISTVEILTVLLFYGIETFIYVFNYMQFFSFYIHFPSLVQAFVQEFNSLSKKDIIPNSEMVVQSLQGSALRIIGL